MVEGFRGAGTCPVPLDVGSSPSTWVTCYHDLCLLVLCLSASHYFRMNTATHMCIAYSRGVLASSHGRYYNSDKAIGRNTQGLSHNLEYRIKGDPEGTNRPSVYSSM